VGLVHNYMNYEPYTDTWAAKWYLQPVCNTMQYIWGTDILLKYFQTGKFLWQAPVGGRVEFDEGSKPGLDFIGMNYYGRCASGLLFSRVHADSLSVPCARVYHTTALAANATAGMRQDASDKLHLVVCNVLVRCAKLQCA